MKILTSSGLVRAKRQGGFTMYSVDAGRLQAAMELLCEFLSGPEVGLRRETGEKD